MAENCSNCNDNISTTTLPVHKVEQFGIPISIVDSSIVEQCSLCGKLLSEPAIQHPQKLQEAVALYRCCLPERLNGAEMKFVRKTIGMAAKDWAKELSVDAATLSRWETNNRPMSAQAEKLLRLTVVAQLYNNGVRNAIDPSVISGFDYSGFAQPMYFPTLVFKLVDSDECEENYLKQEEIAA